MLGALWLALLPLSAFGAESNGRAGLVWPGASAMDGVEVAIGAGFMVSAEETEGNGQGPLLPPRPAFSGDVIWGPTEGLALELQGVMQTNGVVLAFLGGRYVVHDTEHFKVAPWAGATLVGPFDKTGWDLMTMAGVALDFGGERVRGDVSVPVAGLLVLREKPRFVPTFLMFEAGTSLHPSATTSLRLGLASYIVTLRWRHELGAFHYELDVASVGVGFYQGRVGGRF